MSPRAIGVLLGSIAAGTFEVSYLLLAAQARRATTAVRPDAAFLGRLARRPWWLVAMGLNGVAFVLELAALRRVPLLVVQPLLSLGLVGLVVGARLFLGERIGRRQMIGVVLVGGGGALVVAGPPASGGAVGLRGGRRRHACRAGYQRGCGRLVGSPPGRAGRCPRGCRLRTGGGVERVRCVAAAAGVACGADRQRGADHLAGTARSAARPAELGAGARRRWGARARSAARWRWGALPGRRRR